VGSACLIAYGGACARASLTQQHESDAFDQAVRARIQARQQQIHEESPNRREWSPARVAKYEASLEAPVRAIGRLEIPEVDLSVMVLEGTEPSTLDRAVGHIRGTSGSPATATATSAAFGISIPATPCRSRRSMVSRATRSTRSRW
jgi:sortase (surface protein transpeptidase)